MNKRTAVIVYRNGKTETAESNDNPFEISAGPEASPAVDSVAFSLDGVEVGSVYIAAFEPVEPLYYIQNRGYCGDCLKWWKPNGQGYTLNLDRAWKVAEEKARQVCSSRPDEDIMWPASLIDRLAARHLNSESLPAGDRVRAGRGGPR